MDGHLYLHDAGPGAPSCRCRYQLDTRVVVADRGGFFQGPSCRVLLR
jgi:hypothetical protein